MTDIDTDFDFEDAEDEVTETEEATETTEAPAASSRSHVGRKGPRTKHPVPDGWDTPADLAIYINYHIEEGELDLAPVTSGSLYALRSKEGFPSKEHTDERTIVNREAAIEWLNERKVEMAEAARERALAAVKKQDNQVRAVSKAVAAFAKVAASL